MTILNSRRRLQTDHPPGSGRNDCEASVCSSTGTPARYSAELYRSITRSYYRGPAGCLLIYDVTSRRSFDNTRRDLVEGEESSLLTTLLFIGWNQFYARRGEAGVRRDGGEVQTEECECTVSSPSRAARDARVSDAFGAMPCGEHEVGFPRMRRPAELAQQFANYEVRARLPLTLSSLLLPASAHLPLPSSPHLSPSFFASLDLPPSSIPFLLLCPPLSPPASCLFILFVTTQRTSR
ncbi:hypothetical protein B0H13DRAFT_2661633 [Mycena leptocephala]|nr:hypothetical protein B0H13DRAFT_2661633 [Mycena leptocephala]